MNESVSVWNLRYKHDPRRIHAVVLQKRPQLRRSQRASGSFSGIHSIKWGSDSEIWDFSASLSVWCELHMYLKIPPVLREEITGSWSLDQNVWSFTFYSLCIICYSRLCNMAVQSKAHEHLCQHIDGQQEHPRSAASPPGSDHPRANRLVCQIRTPLVPHVEPWLRSSRLFHLQRVGLVVL